MKKTSILSRVLGIFCTLVLIISALYVPAVFSISAAEAQTITFENYPYTAPTGNTSINTVTIEEGEGLGMDDNYALHFRLDTDDTYLNASGATVKMSGRISQREHCAVIGSVTQGNVYRVTYYYKTTADTTSRYNIFLSTASPTNIWSNYAKINSTEKQIAKGETGWVKETVIFTAAPSAASANGLYIHFTFSTNKANHLADAYVDNVTVEDLGANVIFFHSNAEGVEDKEVTGEAGTAFTAPEMTNGRKPLLGWYLDAECTTPFTATTIPEGVTDVYALWGDGPLTFEAYPYSTATGVFGRNMSIVNEEGIGNDDDWALRFRFDGDEVYSTAEDGTVTYMSSRAAQRDHIATIGKIKNGSVYKVTYYVKAGENCETAFSTVLATAQNNNIWSGYKRYDDTRVYHTVTDSEWIKVTSYFQAEITDSKYDTLYLQFNSSNATKSAYVEAYADYVEIEELAGSVMFFHPRLGVMEDAVINGESGSQFTAPEFNAGRKEILGWYTDTAYTNEFTGTTFPDGITHLYAKWDNGPITFENYPYTTLVGGEFGRTLSLYSAEGFGYDDDWALRFNFDGSEVYKTEEDGTDTYMSSRAAQRDHIATAGNIKEGSVYRVSYYVKAGETCETDFSTVLSTASGNIWGSDYKSYTETKVYHKAGNKEWAKVTNYIQATSADTLYIQFNSSNATKSAFVDAYVDHIEIEELAGSVIFFHPNIGVKEDVVINGEKGTKFTVPEIKVGRKELLGWYTDEECTSEFTSDIYPEGITHLYAKWDDGPITFENYPYSTTTSGVFGRTMSIYSKTGFGVDDNYALRFNFDGDAVYSTTEDGTVTYMNTRAAQRDHIATVGSIKKGCVYKVSYYYKSGADSKTAYTLHLAASINSNIWGSNFKQFSATRINGSSNTKEWTKVSFVISTADITDEADTLFIKFNSSNSTTDAYVDAYVDNVTIEEIEPPFVLVNANNGEDLRILQGTAGSAISLPTVTRHGYSFVGWYTDEELTVPFTATAYTDGMAQSIYAKWSKHSSVTYDFESYDVPTHDESGYFMREDIEHLKTDAAYSGDYVIAFDRTGEYNSHSSWMVIADGDQPITLEKGKKYAVSVQYYVAKEMDEKKHFNIRLKTATNTNYWGSAYAFNDQQQSIRATTKVGKWNNLVFLIDTSDIKDNGTALYLFAQGGKGGIIYFDDITVTEVPEGYGVVGIQKEECTNISPIIMGKIGTDYYSKLPTNASVDGKYFKGYYQQENGAWVEVSKEKAKFTDELTTVMARFLDYKITQDFEGVYYENSLEWESYTFYDFDYEIYDSQKEGNSADNVTSGRYSLHRKGDTMFFENASILTWGEEIAEGERYTVTFKVKVGKHAHTDGAIKIASGRSFRYQWTTSGDYYAVTSIADIADGQWHTVSYTFNSVEAYAVIQTPGHVELFIDDITFSLVDDLTPLSFQSNYTEYVPAELDEAGNLISADSAIDVSTIIDTSLLSGDSNNTGFNWLIVVIAAAALIVIGGAAAVIIILAKKKKSKA